MKASEILTKYTNFNNNPVRYYTPNELYDNFMQEFAENAQTNANKARDADDEKARKYWHYVSIAAYSILHHSPLKRGNEKYEDRAAEEILQAMSYTKEQMIDEANALMMAIEANTPLRKDCKHVRKLLLRLVNAFDEACTNLGEVMKKPVSVPIAECANKRELAPLQKVGYVS